MNNKLLIDLFIIIGILSSLAIIIYIAIVFKSDAGLCYQDPLLYASQKLSESNKAEFYGTGYFMKPNSPIVHFNSKNWSVEYPR